MSEKKIIFTGNFGVGKSSIFKRLVNNTFEEKYLTTIGVKVGRCQLHDQTYTLWDIAGEISQDKIPPTYFLNTQHIFYVIDLSRPSTFNNIEQDLLFLKEKYNNCTLHTIGNKIDLLTKEDDLQSTLSKIPCKCNLLTSAKTGTGIEQISQLLNA